MARMNPGLSRLADAQHGVFSASQAATEGTSRQLLHWYVTKGEVERSAPAIYRVVGSPSTWHQRLMTACLAGGPGTLASHRSAAVLWGIGRFRGEPVEVVSPRWARLRQHGIDAHETLELNDEDTSIVGVIPTVSPTRCLLQLGQVAPDAAVEAALDDAIRADLTSLEAVGRQLQRLGRSGRNGIGAVRRVLDLKALAPGVSESRLESEFLRLIVDAGLELPARQVDVQADGSTFRLDFAYADRRLAIELDGRRFHEDPTVFERDRQRQNILVALGWTVLRFTWNEVMHRPHSVVARVRTVLASLSKSRLD